MPFLLDRTKREPWQRAAEKQAARTGLRNKIFYPEGGYYKGNWENGYQSGRGVEVLPKGIQYEGDWLCNKKHGYGVISRRDLCENVYNLVYTGDFKNNRMDGYGCWHLSDKSFYEGEFKNNKRHGFGRCHFKDKSYYEGYWVEDLKHGYGMLVKANGNRYEGEWFKGKKSGWGIYFHLQTGQKQTGYWENNICVTSYMEDINYRQSAIKPTPYPIQVLGLDSAVPCMDFLRNAESNIFKYNEGCQLHKYCYKMSPPSKEEEQV